jgi:hypothetical protein
MRLNRLMALLGLALFLLSSKCDVETMEVPFIKDQLGLKEEHLKQLPLMERVYCPPGAAVCEVMRVYADGSLYFYSAADPKAPLWAYLTKVKAGGVSQLNEIFAAACKLGAAPAAGQGDMGSETFRFHTDACTKEVVIYGISYGDYKAFEQVTHIVNGNLEPVVVPSK